MSIVGLLPASGSASRMGGIPKFCLPIADNKSILEWHVEHLRRVSDRVRVCTRAHWIPIVQMMQMHDVEILAIEPSTMSDAVAKMWMGERDLHIIGMPDTYIMNSDNGAFYDRLAEASGDITLASWKCHAELRGRVGQIQIEADGRVTDSVDKQPGCSFPDMWGAMALRGVTLDRALPHPGVQVKSWITEGRPVRAFHAAGTYMDIGTVAGLKMLYQSL